MTLTRRDAIGRTAGAVAGVLAFTYCDGNGDGNGDRDGDPPQPQPVEPEVKETKVQRLKELYRASIPCDRHWRLWRGPKDALVHVTLQGGQECAAVLGYTDPEGITFPVPDLPSAHPNNSIDLKTPVPENHTLGVQCAGPLDQGHCIAIVTAVEPLLPDGVTAGTPQIVEAGEPVTDPVTAPPLGARVTVTCGKSATLWEGKSSFVTVWLRGAATCVAQVSTEGEQVTTSSSYRRVDTLRTLGPITKLTGTCLGAQLPEESCEFQVVETIELPE